MQIAGGLWKKFFKPRLCLHAETIRMNFARTVNIKENVKKLINPKRARKGFIFLNLNIIECFYFCMGKFLHAIRNMSMSRITRV